MQDLLDEFYELYKNRPITDNNGGMKSPHMFNAWATVKRLQPKVLIESGVWKGLGTWFFEQASPNTRIISIDPAPIYRVYTSPKTRYLTEDFLVHDWSETDKGDSLVFFDDHQNSLERIKACHKLGFRRLMFEDNYPWQQGDCYTPKKILSQKNYVIDVAGNRNWHRASREDYSYLTSVLDKYEELPPIFKPDVTRWGTAWDEEYPTPNPVLELTSDNIAKYPIFHEEMMDYTWICYMELKP